MLDTCLVCMASSLGQSVIRWPRPPQNVQPLSPVRTHTIKKTAWIKQAAEVHQQVTWTSQKQVNWVTRIRIRWCIGTVPTNNKVLMRNKEDGMGWGGGRSPPRSSFSVCNTWRTGGTFCLASINSAFRSIRTDSSVSRRTWSDSASVSLSLYVFRFFFLPLHLPQPLLMKVVAIPVLPDRPVRPILWTGCEGTRIREVRSAI